MPCKLQRVTQMQTNAVSNQLRAIFTQPYADRSPEQAVGVAAEGRVELGFNTNSGWCR